MRLFYGIQLEEELKDYLFDLILHFQSYIPAGVKWVEKENLHLTFQFVGQVKPNQLAEVEASFKSSITSCNEEKFQLKSVELLPNNQPHLIWISLDSKNEDFADATKKLRYLLKQQGFNLDNNDFRPHITLGRIKNNLMKAQIEFIQKTELEKQEFNVNKITLFESNLTKKGANYRVLKTYNLI
jgi:2'-5' RNA ligase